MMVEPNADRIVPRRRALLLAGVGLGSLGLAACGGAGSAEGQSVSSSSGSSNGGVSGSEASAGASGSSSSSSSVSEGPSVAPSSGGETIVKGYSGGSKAPEGEYRAADEHGPAQNVPKPKEPAGMNVETVEGVVKFLNYWNDIRNYSFQTGDAYACAAITSAEYKIEGKTLNSIANLYARNNGWAVGGLREMVIKPETFHTDTEEGLYKILTHIDTQKLVIYDPANKSITPYDYSVESLKMAEISLVFDITNKWMVTGKRLVDVKIR